MRTLSRMEKINTGDTAWLLISAALVMLMTPALGFFYGGLVRRKNVLATIMHSFFILALISVQWVLWGYSLAFGPDHGGLIGGLDWAPPPRGGPAPGPRHPPPGPPPALLGFPKVFAGLPPPALPRALARGQRVQGLLPVSPLFAA